MRNGRVYIVDKLVMGYNHVMFNTAISAIVAKIFKDDQVLFIAESTHSREVEKNNASIDNLGYQPYEEAPLPQQKLKKIIPWIKKKIGDILFINRFYSNTKKEASDVFFTCLSTTSLYFAGYRFRESKAKVYFILHGEVEFVFDGKFGVIDRIKGKIYKRMLKNMHDNMHCIVLSEMVKARLIQESIVGEDKIITIEHPIITKEILYEGLNSDTVIFSHIGSAMNKKRSELFFELAGKFQAALAAKKTAFNLIGKFHYDFFVDNMNGVTVVSENNRSVSQHDYEQFIQQSDYAVFTFDSDNYVFRVSGALMDAVLFRKPIIALKQDYIEYLFREGGNIGFLCESLGEMIVLIDRLIKRDPVLLSQYSAQQHNLGILMDRFSIESVGKQLNRQLH